MTTRSKSLQMKSGSGYDLTSTRHSGWNRSAMRAANSIINSNAEDLPPALTHKTLRNRLTNSHTPSELNRGQGRTHVDAMSVSRAPNDHRGILSKGNYSSITTSSHTTTTINAATAHTPSINNICNQQFHNGIGTGATSMEESTGSYKGSPQLTDINPHHQRTPHHNIEGTAESPVPRYWTTPSTVSSTPPPRYFDTPSPLRATSNLERDRRSPSTTQ